MFISAETQTAPMLDIVLIFLGAIMVIVSTVGEGPNHGSKPGSAE